MPTRIVRHFAPLAGALLVLATACGGTTDLVGKGKLDAVKDGAKLADVVAVIGEGPLKANQPGDSLRLFHGYRTQAFLASGQQYQVIWYREKGGNLEQPISREGETPIMLHADTVMGHGWQFFDEKAEALGIPNPLRSQARLDSIVKSQKPQTN